MDNTAYFKKTLGVLLNYLLPFGYERGDIHNKKPFLRRSRNCATLAGSAINFKIHQQRRSNKY